MKKVAIILFNLGGPDSLESVKPFLFNLFNDPAIIRLPFPLRQGVAKLISSRRDKKAQAIYSQIGGKSPILENTLAQAEALDCFLKDDPETEFKSFVAMRYWHPFIETVVKDVQAYQPDEIVLLPLYPQFSTTTTESSFKAWKKASQKLGLKITTHEIISYPDEFGFIQALTDLTWQAYREAQTKGTPRLLFSAHGLPEKISRVDPYKSQCEVTAEALAQSMGIPDLDWVLCFQSRVGPLKWIEPATDKEILRAGQDKVPVVIVPLAFVSEHSETLVELDLEYRHLAEQVGVPFYACVPTVSVAPAFIAGLAGLVHKSLAEGK